MSFYRHSTQFFVFESDFDPHFEVFSVIGETKAKQIQIRREKIARGREDQSNLALKLKKICTKNCLRGNYFRVSRYELNYDYHK